MKQNKGFSLVELIIVVGIIVIFVGLAGGSLSVMYNSRTKKAVNIINTMIAQCKIDEMSGTASKLCVKYNSSQKKYYCEITDSSGNVCESKELGNNHLNIKIYGNGAESSAVTVDGLKSAELTFNSRTGALVTAKGGTTDILSGKNSVIINVSAWGTPHFIRIYKTTGGHSVDDKWG